jgi:hypothetical protein
LQIGEDLAAQLRGDPVDPAEKGRCLGGQADVLRATVTLDRQPLVASSAIFRRASRTSR